MANAEGPRDEVEDEEIEGDEALVLRRRDLVRRVREELQIMIRESGTTQREIETRNGFTPRYLSQVLNGRITLTVRHMAGILFALDVDPIDFFERLAGPRYPMGSPYFEIRERLARYDAALDELERRGLVSPARPETAAPETAGETTPPGKTNHPSDEE